MKQAHAWWRVLPTRWAVLAVGVALALGTLGAGAVVAQLRGRAASGGPEGSPRSGPAAVAPVRLAVTPGDGATQVRLDTRIRVTAASGTITSVKVTAPGRPAVKGALASGGDAWLSAGPLEPGTRYRVAVVAADAARQPVRSVSSFTTLRPAGELRAAIMPLDGETVGVGCRSRCSSTGRSRTRPPWSGASR
jgi:hypothetical protein